MTHAWCSDPSRDEAVRAAEDGRTSPLPTLKECIVRPFADAAERSVPVRKPGEGQSGMRTERVTLEITRPLQPNYPAPVNEFPWTHILRDVVQGERESVRVVEEAVGSVDDRAYADRMGCDEERDFANRILAERDAAIRERDALQARVAELEAASGGGEGEPVAWAASRNVFDRITNERDAALAEVERLRKIARAAPQPRGWLTGEEREALEWWCGKNCPVSHGQVDAWRGALRNLLARSTPPEVRKAELGDRKWRDGVSYYAAHKVDAALAAAGVEVEE